jgi:asparagine synthase (glutamine-hydrolysing)
MVADVPLGAFLSGGIDSSLVVALMQKCSARPVKTFTLGFREAGYDEAAHAARVAAHLGCDHTELYVTSAEAMSVIPRLPGLYDEPFADSSQIPTYIVSELARQHVTVSLSGDGGDEVFGGYTRYQWATTIWQKIGFLPIQLRRPLAALLARLPYRVGDTISRSVNSLLPASAAVSNPGDKLQKLAEILHADSPEALYYNLVSQWSDPMGVVLGASVLPATLTDPTQWEGIPDFARGMMLLDTITYLPDDILVKLDRASMGVSLESRVPFLDHRVIEFSWQLPLAMKIREGQTKWLLKQVLYKYIPRELIDRPKSGFGVPLHAWLRGPLRDWAEELLDANRLRSEGFFDPVPIRRKWAEHLSGKHNRMYPLWNVLMFQAWLEYERAQSTGINDIPIAASATL